MTTYRLSANDDDTLRLTGDDESELTDLTVADAATHVARLEAQGHTVRVRPSASAVLAGQPAVSPEEVARGAVLAVAGPQFVGGGVVRR